MAQKQGNCWSDHELLEHRERSAQRSCGGPNPGSVQGQAGLNNLIQWVASLAMAGSLELNDP